jgi:membrane associated rhomboid family serine protease
MFLPYNVDVPMRRWPIANWMLIALTILISYLAWQNGTIKELDWALSRRTFAGDQLFSHVFVHADHVHLFGNMIFLFCFGNAINAKLGHFRFVLLYLALGALAGLAWLAAGGGGYAVGASGAISGVTGMFFVLYPRNDVSVFWWLGRHIGVFQIAAYWVVLAYFLLDAASLALGVGGGVAYIAHVAGTLAGAALAVGMLYARLVRSNELEEDLLQVLGLTERKEQVRPQLRHAFRRVA